jgi:hypothetical protein
VPCLSKTENPIHQENALKATLTIDVEYDPAVTDPESIASAADRLMETALSTPGIMEEYADPHFGEFFVAQADGSSPKPGPNVIVEVSGGVLQAAYSSDPAVQLVLVDWDTEGCTPDDGNGIFAIAGNGGTSRLVLVTAFPTVPIDQMGGDTGRALELAGIGPQPEPEVEGRQRSVLYDLDSDSLLSTRAYSDHNEAVDYASQANDVLVLSLMIQGIAMGTSNVNSAAIPKMLAACQAVVDRWEHGDLAEAVRMCSDAVDMALAKHGDEDDSRSPAINALLAKTEAAGLKAEDLDEIVHELTSSIAADVNNSGIDGQLSYLIEEMGVQETTKQIEQLTEKRSDSSNQE